MKLEEMLSDDALAFHRALKKARLPEYYPLNNQMSNLEWKNASENNARRVEAAREVARKTLLPLVTAHPEISGRSGRIERLCYEIQAALTSENGRRSPLVAGANAVAVEALKMLRGETS